MGLSHKKINWIIAGVVMFLVILGIVLGVTLTKKGSTTPGTTSYEPVISSTKTAPRTTLSHTQKAPSTTTPAKHVWYAWGGMNLNNDDDSDATGFVFRDQDSGSDKCTWDPSVRGTNGKDLDDHWKVDGICPGKYDNDDTVPVCAAAPYWEDKTDNSDAMRFDCGYEDLDCSRNDYPNRCDPDKVGTNVEKNLNSLQKGSRVGIIEDDGSCTTVDPTLYEWEADSDNVQVRAKATSCPYYKSGSKSGCDGCKHHKLFFMPIKGTCKSGNDCS